MKKTRLSSILENAWLITVFVLIFAIAVGVVSWFQLKGYEEGIMEVYSLQQDGYVQLVLDQINLEKHRQNDEIIRNILGTLDASSNKYWTLAQDDALVFVRDVMETNRYRGFSSATYYESSQAREFLDNLQVDRVTHSIIEMNGRRFVASGARFPYRGNQLQVTLLTSADSVLDQNAYLNAKINISILALIELFVLVLTTVGLAALTQKWKKNCARVEKENNSLRLTVEKCNEIVNKRDLYDTRQMLFQRDALDVLLTKLEEHNAWPVHFVLIGCDTDIDQRRFLYESQIMMDRSFFRVLMEPRQLLLIGIKVPTAADQVVLAAIRQPGIHVLGSMAMSQKPAVPLTVAFQEFYQQRGMTYAAQAIS